MASPQASNQFQTRWAQEEESSERDKLLNEFQTYARPIRTQILKEMNPHLREQEGSLYPEISDERFLKKLLGKREFRETKQAKITDETLRDNVCNVEEFEYTSAQKFASQFMSPNTPYNGMLLYHGVGVGKTCSAVLTAESFLQLSPKNKVYILAPPAIQAGFYRTIFDSARLTIGEDSDQQNEHEGCTGNRYLELTQTLYEKEKKDIVLRVNRLINKRYSIMGYVAFRNMVRDILNQIPSTLPPERKIQQRTILLQKAFSGCLIIVDEAHNMRDVSDADDETDQADDFATSLGAGTSGATQSDSAAGKKLVPMLREVLKLSEGNKLLLMSATPMYNTYKEIVSLLNLLLLVDKVPESELLRESDLRFELRQNEEGREIEVLSEQSENRIIEVANGHVSFMRGENPKAFPARLDPAPELRISKWPFFNPNGKTKIEPDQQRQDVIELPLVDCRLEGEPLEVIRSLTESLIAAKGVGIRTIDTLLQAGNCIFPGEGMDSRVGSDGFQTWFQTKAIAGSFEGTRLSVLPQYIPAIPEEPYTWMLQGDTLQNVSPKFNIILKTIQQATGISFVYSRFVENGAIIFCLLLEANGYSPYGRSAPLFSKGPLSGGRQCSKCSRKEQGHPGYNPSKEGGPDNHKFAPAYYALLTASDVNTPEKASLPLSPNNTGVINVARSISKYDGDTLVEKGNEDGHKIKVVVGSQVAGEGLDLRNIREVHILEGWFHLSKEEQIVGRGIRYCSHNALPRAKRNCTINLYVNTFPEELNKETIDQYSYRTAMNKAVRVGNVSRALKRGAADCNLNRDAILVDGLTSVQMVDSQGVERDVDLNDKDYTPTCDWIRCSYECKPSLNLNDKAEIPDDYGTYDLYAARFAEQAVISRLKAEFKKQPWYHWSKLQEIFKDIPKATLTSLLLRIVNNQSILFENGNQLGHIIYRNNLFLFQPNRIQDSYIPISFRYGRYPVKRDYFEPFIPAKVKVAPVKKTLGKPAQVAQVALEANLPVPNAYNQVEVELSPTVKDFWTQAVNWINSWCIPTATRETLGESISPGLSSAILNYVEGDVKKKDNFEIRIKKLQWWAKAIVSGPNPEEALNDLKQVCKEFIWDSFFKGPEQLSMLREGAFSSASEGGATTVPSAAAMAAKESGSEQMVPSETIQSKRYLDIVTKEPMYTCDDKPCPPSVLKLFLASKTDPVVNAKANRVVSSNPYGFMVPWEGAIMFKTNDAQNAEGSPPGSGAACSIVSTVKGHRMKIIVLGDILTRYSGYRYELTEEILSSGYRKLTGAPSFCALMEIVMRWMDVRKASYGNLRYFYRPLSSFYSKHKSKK